MTEWNESSVVDMTGLKPLLLKNLKELSSTPSQKLNDVAASFIVLAKEKGNDHFTTVQDAINAVPANNTVIT